MDNSGDKIEDRATRTFERVVTITERVERQGVKSTFDPWRFPLTLSPGGRAIGAY